MGIKQLTEKSVSETKTAEIDEELRSILEKRKTQIKVVGAGGAGSYRTAPADRVIPHR